jgi:hypothetical protein
MQRIHPVILLAVTCLTAFWWVTAAADQPNEDALTAFMRGKLDAAESVLEGLVTEDFELIQQGADQMHVMSQRAEWNVITTPVYVQYSDDFRRAVERLGNAAKGQNLEAAALAQLQVTLSCINCHKHLRGAKVALKDFPPLGPAPAAGNKVIARAGLANLVVTSSFDAETE